MIELHEFNMSDPLHRKTIRFERKARTHDSAGLKLAPGIVETEVTISDNGAGTVSSFWLHDNQAQDIARLLVEGVSLKESRHEETIEIRPGRV